MPFVHVSSNVAKSGVDVARAIRELSKALSLALDRPEPAVMVQLSLDQAMLFAGSDAPCAMIQIRSIGKIDAERNPKTVQALTATVTELLGVPAERVFVSLDDIASMCWGAQGTTVDRLQM